MILLTLLFVCHFLGDYTHLSMGFMLSAKRFGKPLIPILTHAMVHGVLMLAPLCVLCPQVAAELFALQVVTHFAIDVWKGRMNVRFPSLANPANKLHWYIFGFESIVACHGDNIDGSFDREDMMPHGNIL